MKRFWIIPTLAVLAAMIFGSLLHRRGQESPRDVVESSQQGGKSRLPSFVSESQLPVQETEMPFDFPLMPELLPEPTKDLPKVSFGSDSLVGAGDPLLKEKEAESRQIGITSTKRHVSTVDLAKLAAPKAEPGPAAVEKAVEPIPAVTSASDGRFLPIVLHIGSEDGKLVLQGSIPTRESTDAVYAAAVKVVGEDSVESHLKYSPETLNADWVAYLPDYVEKFFSHSAGAQELIVVDGILKLRGDVPSDNSKNGLVVMAGALKDGGLEIDPGLIVKESLAGDLPELPESYAALVDEESVTGKEPKEVIELAMLDSADQLSIGDDAQSRSASISAEELELKSDSEEVPDPVVEAAPVIEVEDAAAVEEVEAKPSFVGPAVSPEEWAAGIKKAKEELAAAEAAAVAAAAKKKAEMEAAAKAKAEVEAAAVAAAAKKKAEMEVAAKRKAEKEAAALVAAENAKAEKEAADAAAKEAKLAAMLASGERIPDDGKPLIFYFETGSSEIISSDREKLVRAKQRVQVSRSIVYITAYADYRGGYELNRKLSLERAEKVRSLIFEGDVADEVTAEITAKGDSQSVRRDMGKRESDEALKRARRVVVEVYHLKR